MASVLSSRQGNLPPKTPISNPISKPSARTPSGVPSPPYGRGSASRQSPKPSPDLEILYKCRRATESDVRDVRLRAGATWARVLERLTVEFGAEVVGFSYWSAEEHLETVVNDEVRLGACVREALRLSGDAEQQAVDDARMVDVTVTLAGAPMAYTPGRPSRLQASPQKDRTGYFTSTHMTQAQRERNRERERRLKEIDQLFSAAPTTPAATGGSGMGASGLWAVSYPLHAAAEGKTAPGRPSSPRKRVADERNQGLAEVRRVLEDKGGSIALNEPDGLGRTALHYAAGRGRIGVVEHLIRESAQVDAPDATGCTPLHRAAQAGHSDVIRALVMGGAEVNRASKVVQGDARGPSGGETPLFMAARAGHNQTVAALLRLGANPDVVSAGGLRARDVVPKGESSIVALLRAGRPDKVRMEEGGNEEDDAPLENAPEAVGTLGELKETLADRARTLAAELQALDVVWATSRGTETQGMVRRQLKEAQGAMDTLADAMRVMSKLHANRYS